MKIELTQEIVRELLHYDPETGLLYWKERDRKWFKRELDFKSWNSRYKGKSVDGIVKHSGYMKVYIFNKAYFSHRIIWLLFYGDFPKDQLDHINGIKHDNRIENLREVTNLENCKNQKLQKNNKSGYKGVSWCKREKRWVANIRLNGILTFLGYFDTPELAFRKYADVASTNGFTERHIYG